MKRRIGFVLLVTFALCLTWILVPSSRAGSQGKGGTAKIQKAGPASGGNPVKVQRSGRVHRESGGLPNTFDERAPMSAAVATFLGGRNGTFNEVDLLGNFDGREDYAAERGAAFDDFTGLFIEPDATITRVGISEHTVANGFNENVMYYGDTAGNFWVGTDINPGINATPFPSVDTLLQVNIPQLVRTNSSGGFTLLNPAGDCTDDQVTITGIAVNPVADLGDFGLCDTIGEVVYVSILDTGGCSSNAANQPIRTRIFAFGLSDGVAGVVPAGALIIHRNVNSSAGIAVDDDGSLYFHIVDNVLNTQGAIFKVTELPHIVAACGAGLRTQRVITNVPTVSLTSVTPLSSSSARITNFSGSAPTWGNVVAIAAAPGSNTLYAALARSLNPADDAATQNTEGTFQNPAALGPTPSMIVSLSDTSGAFDVCSGQTSGSVATNIGGGIPVGDGFADVAVAGQARVNGVNNFRVFALGNGPDIRPVSPATSPIVTSSTLKLAMQFDASSYAGITVDEEGTVYAISGGNPAFLGHNPSQGIGEILAFQDQAPADRRADYIDLRGDSTSGNTGDGDSDRFDHIYWQAPNDSSGNPSGVSGLARGFLRYTNRLAPNAISPGVTLGVTQGVQGDDDHAGPIIFEGLDPSHQVAGGDDQNAPFRGDDSDGFAQPLSAGNPVVAGALGGGFEFVFGATGATNNVWNAFFLNSNGNITFDAGDDDNTATATELYAGPARIAPAWGDFNPSARNTDLRTFPVQALGFAAVNAFKIRYINVPEFGNEACSGVGGGRTNTFAATLYDDGTGVDENSNQPLNPANPIGNNAVPFDLREGPTDLRFVREPVTGNLVGATPRPDGSGYFVFDYNRMDALGAGDLNPIITGYGAGNGVNTNPPGLCEVNLGEAARAAENTFGVIQNQTASIAPLLIGEGTEPTLFELFNDGQPASIGTQGEIFLATPDFDLRAEGNDTGLSTPVRQRDLNRGRIGFAGLGLPPLPVITSVTPGPFVVAPNQPHNLINALGPVDVLVTGSGFFPNETTSICSGFGPPSERPGKTVSTAMSLALDNNNDGTPEATVNLTNVTPVNNNLVRGTLAPLTGSGLPGTAFPLVATGPFATLSVTTTFSAGDNNAFGSFSRTSNSPLNVGNRSPVVLTATSNTLDCSAPQNVTITGGVFLSGDGTPNVTSVTAVDGGTLFTATSFTIVDTNNLTATFNFPASAIGHLFLIFANGPNGTSRNLTTLPVGTPAGVPLGNEAGNQVTLSCLDTIRFNTTTVSVNEATSTQPITVQRFNGAATTARVDFTTVDGTATQSGDYEIASSRLTFAPGETTKTINLLINDDSYIEAPETLTVQLSSPSGGPVLDTQSSITVTINDNDAVGALVPVPRVFVARLSGSQEVPANASTATGTAVVLLDPSETSALVSLNFSGLSSPQLSVAPGGAHIHGPAAPGANAPILFPLSPPQPNGPINNFTIALTPAQVDQLKNGLFYVNVHTTNFPGGEIRGQILYNAIDDPANFVGIQYHDFLNRDADPAGLMFWTGQITACGADTACITRRRTAVAGAFFFAGEFQETGFYVIRVYRVAFDTNAATRPTYAEFNRDRSFVVAGGDLNAQKLAFAQEFVTRPEFVTTYPASLTAAQYVDALNTNTGNSLTTAERNALVAGLTGGTETRATVLRTIAENTVFRGKEFNPAFVAMEYMGSLRRQPELGGFNFWLGQLTANGNNQAMVCSFITSAEYQQRFGPNVTRGNSECAGVGP
jgi:hypothetical protein